MKEKSIVEYNESKALKHSNSSKLEYIGKTLLITSGKERVLVVGDLHLGYEEVMNASGILLGRKMLEEIIDDFEKIFAWIEREKGKKVDKIVLLGDVKHSFGEIKGQEWKDITRLLDYLKGKVGGGERNRKEKVVIVKGNHDILLEPILRKSGMNLPDYYFWKEFCFIHGDRDFPEAWKNEKTKTIIVGHGHPAIKLKEPKGAKMEKYKCFLIGKFKRKDLIVVPSFIEYYAGSDPREGEVVLAWNINFDKFNVKIVGENLEVLDFGLLKDLD